MKKKHNLALKFYVKDAILHKMAKNKNTGKLGFCDGVLEEEVVRQNPQTFEIVDVLIIERIKTLKLPLDFGDCLNKTIKTVK